MQSRYARPAQLENFIFASEHLDAELKMIDFGLSKFFSSGEVIHEAVGTPYTVAPEVIRGSYDEKVSVIGPTPNDTITTQ